MLRTRLWMGAVLIALTVGVLLVDGRLGPWYPFLYLLALALSLLGTAEALALLGPSRRPWPWLAYLSVATLVSVPWIPHLCPWAARLSPDPQRWVMGVFAATVLAAFLAAMASYRPPEEGSTDEGGHALTRLALTVFLAAYLGLLPTYLVQLRWPADGDNTRAVVSLALAIFVPKICDSGAYFAGRLLGRHKMTPILSPKKTWEGLAGGLVAAVAGAVAINRAGPVLSDLAAAGLGLMAGVAGVLGDLAESFVKRECRKKDASQVMPGFGGVLDVVDSIIFAAPVAYCWLR